MPRFPAGKGLRTGSRGESETPSLLLPIPPNTPAGVLRCSFRAKSREGEDTACCRCPCRQPAKLRVGACPEGLVASNLDVVARSITVSRAYDRVSERWGRAPDHRLNMLLSTIFGR